MVYFVQECGTLFVKIGFADGGKPALLKRMTELQTGNPRPLVAVCAIPGGRREESQMHKRFSKHRVRGEWLRRQGELDRFMKMNALRKPITVQADRAERQRRKSESEMVEIRKRMDRFRSDRWHPLDAVLGD